MRVYQFRHLGSDTHYRVLGVSDNRQCWQGDSLSECKACIVGMQTMRVISLSPAVTEILYAIGAGSSIIARDQWSNWPSEAKNIPCLTGHQSVDVSAVAALKPDLVFTSTLVQRELAAVLKDMDIPVIHQDPRSIADIYDSIVQIGILMHAEERGNALISDMRSGFLQVKRRSGLFQRKLRLYIEEWHNPPMVSGNWVPDIAALAGAIPFPLPQRAESRTVTLQEVERFNPEIIVLSICGAGALADKTLISDRIGWSDLSAVVKNRVFVIDDSLLNRPGPRLVEGASRLYGWLFQVMHQA